MRACFIIFNKNCKYYEILRKEDSTLNNVFETAVKITTINEYQTKQTTFLSFFKKNKKIYMEMEIDEKK